MNRLRLEHRIEDDARLLWVLAVTVLILGIYAARTRYEPAIAGANERGATYYARMTADERLLRRAASLKRVERTARAQLSGLRNETLSAATAGLINDLQNAGSASGVRVTKLEPDSVPGQSAVPGNAADLLPQEVTVEAQGRFASLLRFIGSLTRQGSLVQITGTRFALVSGPRAGAQPVLDATIHAVLYRLRADRLKKAGNASAD